MDGIYKDKEENGVGDHIRVKTKLGWLLFWSGGFLCYLIKQKDNSVWILTVTVCPPPEIKSSHMYTILLSSDIT